jgi:uncharacterized protein YecE (DUF72 family)
MLPLFPPDEPAFRVALVEKLRNAAATGVFFGTSSWKYEGWLGQIYTRERYLTRGKFSRKRFEDSCLAEYAEVFPIVCGDFSFYQFPTPGFWEKLFASAPAKLRFAFKVPEEITVRVWPHHARYGDRAGLDNPAFLDARAFQTLLLDLLEPYRERVEVLIFEFGSFPRGLYEREEDFVMDLDRFLGELPKAWRYAVEIRNPEFLGPLYLASLADRGVAHVFNAWTRMPTIGEQMEIPGAFTTDFVVTRALLRQGRAYEQAVQAFEPYAKVQDPNPETRAALKALAKRSATRREKGFFFVNNRLEGNAPSTIDAVLGDG